MIDPTHDPRLRPVPVLCALIVLHAGGLLLSAFAPGRSLLWGLHAWTFLTPGTLVLAAAAALGLGALVLLAPPFPTRVRSIALTALLAGPLLFLARDRTHLLGDGRLWISSIGDTRPYHPNEPLAYAASALAALDLRHVAPATIASRLEVFGTALGVIALVLMLLLAARIGRERRERWGALGLLAISGTIQFAFGYVEAYPLLWVIVLAFFLAGGEAARGRASPIVVALLAGLAFATHIFGVLLLPALLVLLVGLSPRARTIISVVCAAVLPPLVGRAVLPRLMAPGEFGEATLRNAGSTLGSVIDQLAVGRLEPARWILQEVNLLSILAPIGAGLALVALLRGGARTESKDGGVGGEAAPTPRLFATPVGSRFLVSAALTLPLPGLLLYLDGSRGGAADWDVFAVAAVPLVLLAAARWSPVASITGSQRSLLAAAVALGGFGTASFVAVNADRGGAFERFHALLENPDLPHRARALGYETVAMERRDAGQWSESADLYSRALESAPSNVRLRRVRAGVLSWAGRHREAADIYVEAARMEPSYPRVWLNLGMELERAGAPDSAATAYREAIARDGPSVEGLNRLARLMLLRPETREEARALLEQSLRMDPQQRLAGDIRKLLGTAGRDENR